MADDADIRKLRETRWHRTAAIFGNNNDLLWLYRALETRYGHDELLIVKMRDLVSDSLWTTLFNNMDDYSFKDVQGKADEYLSEARLHCAALRNFFLAMLMEHVKKLNVGTSNELKWLSIGVLLFLAIYTYVGHSWAYVFGALFGGYALNTLWRLGRVAITERLINQVVDEVKRGAFEEEVTVERLQRLERRGINIPSILYALLRQSKVNVEEAIRTEWNEFPCERKSEILERQHAWLKDMREYSET